MKEGWTQLEDHEVRGETLWRDEHGFIRMELLPQRIRKQLPPLGSTNGQGDNAIVYASLFAPGTTFDWYITEFDSEDTCFGYVYNAATPEMSELGYFSLSELESISDPNNIKLRPIECDVYFDPTPLSEVKKELEGY
jgi:hypothetical protein